MSNSIIVNDNLKFIKITLTEDHLYDPSFLEFREYDEDGDIVPGCDCAEALYITDVYPLPMEEVCKAFGFTEDGETFTITGNNCEYEAGMEIWALVDNK